MPVWTRYAIAAALFCGLHQVFTKLAAQRIGEGLGGVVVEIAALPLVHTAWLTSLVYSLLNAALLRTRIRVEDEALDEATRVA